MKNTKEIKLLLKQIKINASANPDPLFKSNARIRILNQLAKNKFPNRATALGLLSVPFKFIPRFVVVILLLFFVLVPTSVLAAQGSMPSEPLYPLKRLSEDVILAIAPVDSWKANFSQIVIQRRAEEMRELEKENRQELLQTAADDYTRSVKKAEDLGVKVEKKRPAKNEKNENKQEVKDVEVEIAPSPIESGPTIIINNPNTQEDSSQKNPAGNDSKGPNDNSPKSNSPEPIQSSQQKSNNAEEKKNSEEKRGNGNEHNNNSKASDSNGKSDSGPKK